MRSAHGHHRVTFVELFFDLVFVFAVTQLSHGLLAHFSLLGLLETGMLTLAVWWVWIYTSWITNWLDPEKVAVRGLLFAMMAAGLALSTSLPGAFAERAPVFAIAYVAMQVGRTGFMLAVIPKNDIPLKQNFQRIMAWLCVSAVCWLAGAFVPAMQLPLWGAAIAIEYAGPALRFWVPGLGASNVTDWGIEGGHLAERCALFIIIALGESILVTGATFATSDWSSTLVQASLVAFVGSLAMWWIYFDRAADLGATKITSSEDPGRLGRLAYTYLHLLIVAGIILSAVGDEVLLAHPHGHSDLKVVVGIVGGPLVYLLGVLLFKHTIRGIFQLSHMVGIVLLGALAAFGSRLEPLPLAAATALVLIVVALWEGLSLGRAPAGPAH